MSASAGLSLSDVQPPAAAQADEVVLAVEAAGICGSDLHIEESAPSYGFMTSALPVTIGHEFCARVVEPARNGEGPAAGQRVVVRPSVACNACAACMSGAEDDCTHRTGIGVRRDGAFAARVVAPARNCLVVPPGVSPTLAALAEPLSVGLQAVLRAGVERGQRVLVIGPGTIGQAAALFAREAGAVEVAIAGRDDGPRLSVLRRMGFDLLVDTAAHGNLRAALEATGQPLAYDAIIEASGAAPMVAQGLDVLRPGGVLCACGIPGAPVAVDLAALVRRNHQIRGSYRAPAAQWPKVLAFVAAHPEWLEPMVTHRLPLSQALEGFALSRSRQASKVMLMPGVRADEIPEARP
jgi:threonine 3-dehydrogenase